jgi:hypothetical protein
MGSDNGAKTAKLVRLTQLENEVAKLSEQLKTNKQSIILLKKTLTERDLRIQELESKLIYAQQSLLKKAIFTIHQCRDQIKNGIDEKVINPGLTQIQQQIEVIRSIIHEAKELVSKKKMLIQENINVTSNIVHQCPDQAIRYFEKMIVEPSRILVNDVSGLIDSNVKVGQDLVTQKIIYPGKMCYDTILVVVSSLPTQGRAIFQMWVVEPTKNKLHALPVIGKELQANASVLLIGVIAQLKSRTEQGFENTVEAIKKSPFWDGKHKMEAA